MEKISAPSRCKCHGPRHGPEQAPLDCLQGENRQVGGNDDGDGVKNRALHFMSGFGDPYLNRASIFLLRARWRTMFSTITTAPSTTMPKSSAPSESRLAGNASGRGKWLQTAAKRES